MLLRERERERERETVGYSHAELQETDVVCHVFGRGRRRADNRSITRRGNTSSCSYNTNTHTHTHTHYRFMRRLQLRFDFDSTGVRLFIKGHYVHSDLTLANGVLRIFHWGNSEGTKADSGVGFLERGSNPLSTS